MAKTPQPSYRVIKRSGPFEIRVYEPMILAEVTMPGLRKDATEEGFRVLASYILGNNDRNEKIQMTIPVTMQPYDTKNGNAWTVRFIMPPGRPIEDLPRPDDTSIKLFEVPVGRAAVCRFSGHTNDIRLKKKTKELKEWIKSEQVIPAAPPTYAFYNPPLTLPFLKRNEVMVGLQY